MKDESTEDDALVVHSIAKYACPTVVMWLALRLYPEQLRMTDSQRRLPLYYACAVDPYLELTRPFQADLTSWKGGDPRNWVNVAQYHAECRLSCRRQCSPTTHYSMRYS